MFFFDVRADDPAQELRPHRRTVDVLAAAGHVSRAGIRTDLAFHAVFQRMVQRLQEGPVVFRIKQFFDSGQKPVHKRFFLFRHGRRQNADGHDAVERRVHPFALVFRQFFQRFIHLIIRRRKLHPVGRFEFGNLSAGFGKILNAGFSNHI